MTTNDATLREGDRGVPEPDEVEEDDHFCEVCSRPVMWGSRHPHCGEYAMQRDRELDEAIADRAIPEPDAGAGNNRLVKSLHIIPGRFIIGSVRETGGTARAGTGKLQRESTMAKRTITITNRVGNELVHTLPFDVVAKNDIDVAKAIDAMAVGAAYVTVLGGNDNPHLRKDIVYLIYDHGRKTVQPFFGSRGLDRVMDILFD